MREFDVEAAFESVLTKLGDAYRELSGHDDRMRLLEERRVAAERATTRALVERDEARKERDDLKKKADSGEALWRAVSSFHTKFSEHPTAALADLRKIYDQNEEHLNPDWVPF